MPAGPGDAKRVLLAFGSVVEPGDGRSPASTVPRGVGITRNQGMPGEQLLDVCSLDPLASSVDKSHFPQAKFPRRFKVGIHHVKDIPRPKAVEIDAVGDFKNVDVVVFAHGFVVCLVPAAVPACWAIMSRQIVLPRSSQRQASGRWG